METGPSIDFSDEIIESPEQNEQEKPIDALVVFGGKIYSDAEYEKLGMGESLKGKPELGWRLSIPCRLRVIAAADIYARGEAKDVIMTGGKTKKSEGIDASEAELMRDYCLHQLKIKYRREFKTSDLSGEEAEAEINKKLADANEHIILEDKATNTIENFAYTVNYLEDHRSEYQNIGFLSNDFHINRVMKLAGKMQAKGVGIGADTKILESDSDPRIKRIVDRYMGKDNQDYRQQILSNVSDEERPYVEARLTDLDRFQKDERKYSRALDEIPEYWLPCVRFINNPDQLKAILKAEENVSEVLQEKGIDDIDQASYGELVAALEKIKRRFPPSEWEKE